MVHQVYSSANDGSQAGENVGFSIDLVCLPREGMHCVADPFVIRVEEMDGGSVVVRTTTPEGESVDVERYPAAEAATSFLADLMMRVGGR